jgi:hypothetical protein
VFFGPVENSLQVSAPDRDAMLSDLELKAASASGRIVQALIAHENSSKRKKERDTEPPPGLVKKEVEAPPAAGGTSAETGITAPAIASPLRSAASAPKKPSTEAIPVFSPNVKIPADSGGAVDTVQPVSGKPDSSAADGANK